MHYIITVLSLIPDVIWAAIIASVITLSGVALSNRANRKCLLMQLNHAAKEKDKEREFKIREKLSAIGLERAVEKAKKLGRVDKDGKAILGFNDLAAAGLNKQ